MKQEAVYSSKAAAELLHISKSKLYQLTVAGEIESYRVGRNIRYTEKALNLFLEKAQNEHQAFIKKSLKKSTDIIMNNSLGSSSELVICGQDMCLDILSNYLRMNGIPSLRSYMGSFQGLAALYANEAQVTAVHLWDGDTGEYNIPYIHYLLPGIPCRVIHLTYRNQGFYIKKNNPKNITGWEDLLRDDIMIINREPGAGSRVLLDEHLRLLQTSGSHIKGYYNITSSHLSIAANVLNGNADLGVGAEQISKQIDDLSFIPLQRERYDLVMTEDFFQSPSGKAFMS